MFLKFNSNICRVCLEQEGKLSLFQNEQIAEQFRFCTILEATPNDELPPCLCTKCFKCLKIAYQFKRSAIASDNYLRKFLKTLNTKFSNAIASTKNSLSSNIDAKELNSLISTIEIDDDDNDDHEEIINIEKNLTADETPSSPQLSVNEKASYKIEIVKFNEDFGEFIEFDNIKKIVDANIQQQSAIDEESMEDEGEKQEMNLDTGDQHNIEDIEQTNTQSTVPSRRITRKRYKVSTEALADSLQTEFSSQNPCVCIECNKTFSSKPNLMRHILTHANAKPYQCTVCGDCFTQNGSLKTHMLRHTGERPYECDVCGKAFTRNRVLRIHSRIHTGDTPYECDQCGEKFRVKDSLRRHNAMKHSKGTLKEYPCSMCERILSSKYALDMHLKLHRGEKKSLVHCTICNKAFSNKYSLRNHLKNHNVSTKKEYTCKECKETFETRSSYTIHMQKHQNSSPKTNSETKFICEVCHQILSRKFQLLQHLLTHEDETNVNFSCRKCGKNFTIKENLMEHLRTHNEFAFKCERCNVSFNVKRDLKLHRVNFHKEIVNDLNACDDCGASFVTSTDLNVHIVTKHEAAVNVNCEECGKLFTSNKLFKEHLLEHDVIEIA